MTNVNTNVRALVSSLLLLIASAPVASASPHRAWRDAFSHSIAGEKAIATSPAREALIVAHQASMNDRIFNGHDTPRMELVPEEGVTAQFNTPAFTSSQIPEVTVTGLGSSGVLRGTLALPVSGHTGAANARKWATTDTYRIYMKNSQGTVSDLIPQGTSLDTITLHDLEIPLTQGWNEIYYARSGSDGVGGYADGRTIKIFWDGI